MNTAGHPPLVGLLLAAGRGSRFSAAAVESERDRADWGHCKLLAQMANGDPVCVASARALAASVDRVIALIPSIDDAPWADGLGAVLAIQGCIVLPCPSARLGMGHSIAAGVMASSAAAGWLVLPADMPWVSIDSCHKVADTLAMGATIAAPVYQDRRGHPVGFSRDCRADLLKLEGDHGARSLLLSYPVTEVPVEDAGVLRDIDLPTDLE
ncbi:nucleotidyltransferase family protein [Chitinimonas lacunae]|uniref:NTP transferase domain-containing protein n=1 Tax=Chitinimonas lacunae TaxID=1963018 RepID=A0ABV8MQX1_9NEIS